MTKLQLKVCDMNMTVKELCSKMELGIVRDIAYRTWPSAFQGILLPDQIEYMLAWMYDPEVLKQQLEDGGHKFIVVGAGGAYAGFACYEKNAKRPGVAKLHKLYVLPDYQGKGVGKALLNEVIKRVKNDGQHLLTLNVNRDNKALLFYKSYGFSISSEEDIPIGGGYFMNDFVMDLPLI